MSPYDWLQALGLVLMGVGILGLIVWCDRFLGPEDLGTVSRGWMRDHKFFPPKGRQS
jgi:hypothetical protein